MNVAPAGGANAKAYKNTRFQASRRLPNPFAEMPMRVDSRRRVGTLFRGLRRRQQPRGDAPGAGSAGVSGCASAHAACCPTSGRG